MVLCEQSYDCDQVSSHTDLNLLFLVVQIGDKPIKLIQQNLDFCEINPDTF